MLKPVSEILYISHVGRDSEPRGASHLVIATLTMGDKSRPVVACGEDTRKMNWTGNPKPKTPVCGLCTRENKRSNQP